MAYLTAEAFLLSGIVSSKYSSERQVAPNRQALEAIINYSAQLYSTRSNVNGELVYWEKAEGGNKNSAISSLI